MKTLIAGLIAIVGISAHADLRSVHLEGDDADFIIQTFREVSTFRSVSDPITGNPLMDSMTYRSSALNIGCKVKYQLYRHVPECDMTLNSATIESTDPTLVSILRAKIDREFTSKARASDNTTPLLRIGCSESACTLQ